MKPSFRVWDTMQSGLQFVLCRVNENPKILAVEGTLFLTHQMGRL